MRIHKVISLCVFSVLLVGLLLFLRAERQSEQRAREIEITLKQNVDPEELRQWAIGCMQDVPTNTFPDIYSVTNLPSSFIRLRPVRARAYVASGYAERESHVVLHWRRNEPHVYIGTTNFFLPIDSRVTMWRKGIYIVQPKNQ